jgi:threonine dehydratase
MNLNALPVTYSDVEAAVPRVRRWLPATLLHAWPSLSERIGCQLYIKHENHQPTGAFKVRGGVNLVSQLSDVERAAGILGVSTGNHGQSLAFAASRHGVRCTIVVPEGNNPDKTRLMRGLGAEVIEQGCDFDAARAYVEELTRSESRRYVHSANEPHLIAGVGTMAWEIFQDLPDPDFILVPIGLGSGVCGTCIVAKHLRSTTRVIGVQATGASVVARSWSTGQWVRDPSVETWAEGLATRVPAEMTLDIMRQLMDDVVLVTDEELRWAAAMLLKYTHNLPEGAGAASLAAALQLAPQLQGKRVVCMLSGGNLNLAELPNLLPYVDQV